MDVVFVSDLFRPEDFGGSRYPWEVTRRLATRHRVRVLTPRFGGPLPGATGVEVRHYPISRRTPPETFLTNALAARLLLQREIHRRRPDVIVFNSYQVAYGAMAIMPPRVPMVFIYHSGFHSAAVERLAERGASGRALHRLARRFVATVERVVFERSAAIVAVSPFSRTEIAARLGRDDERIRVIPTGVDTALFSPGDRDEARRRLDLPLDAHLLLTVGRLATVKRYDRAIDALAILAAADPHAQLVIVGRGPMEPSLRVQAQQCGLADRVRFAGFADGERLRDHYRAADLSLCTSDFENWSLALLEAFACGTPAIGTPRGGTPELLGLVDRDLVTDGVEPAAIASRVREWLADDGRRERASRKGREVVAARFSWERTASELERLFEEVTVR